MRPIRVLSLSFLLVLFTIRAEAAGGPDIESWLRRPGVKLLVIEFYATWCKPCMEAMPKWAALHRKYRRDGLRILVVATQDPKACSRSGLGYRPDGFICDSDGRIAELFGANPLPAAYLWSWQGNLLVDRSHVEDVETGIVRWMRETPRIDVQVAGLAKGSGTSERVLANMVRGRLQQQDKLTVVATEEERRQLNKLKLASLEARYDDALQCEIGKDLSANSLLEVFISGKRRSKKLQLTLLSAERGCLVSSATVDWYPKKPAVSVAEAVSGLMQKVVRKTQLPWAKSTPKASGSLGFGKGLGTLGAVPTLGTFRGTVPRTSLSEMDVTFLETLQAAKRTEKRSDASASQKAEAWAKVARYKGTNPLRAEAKKRAKEWQDVAKAEAERKAQLERVRRQYEADKTKLSKLLALDDDVLPPAQKRAAKEEFDKAYAPWIDALGPRFYSFSGVAENLPISKLKGWKQCYVESYGKYGRPLSEILSKCSGPRLLIGCRKNGSSVLQVAAQAPREDVLHDTGASNSATHLANGVQWYFHRDGSSAWGFAPPGVTTNRGQCDQKKERLSQRLCWHVRNGNIGYSKGGGYNCGRDTFLGSKHTHERMIFHQVE